MRSLRLLAPFLLALAVLLPRPGYAQLFDGPEPADESVTEEIAIINTADLGLVDDDELTAAEAEVGEDDWQPLAPSDDETIAPGLTGCALCATGGPCGRGCCDNGWVCLEDVINWHNAKRHLHKMFMPLKKLPFYPHLHKLKERKPMQGTSWLNRPLHVDWFVGALVGDGITRDLDLDTAFLGGYRVGKDVSSHWGYETRLMFAAPDITGPGGTSIGSTADVIIGDVSGVYYPWGDTTARPYLTTGLGLAHFDFRDANNVGRSANVLAIPIGAGMKWRYNNWTLLRFELLDNISFSGSGVRSMHNVTLTGGVEIRFGGYRTGYWPWNPGSFHR